MKSNVMDELEKMGRNDLVDEILKYEQEQAEKAKYNGWSNYETWCVNLWIDNDEGLQDHVIQLADEALETEDGGGHNSIWSLSQQIEGIVDEMNPLADKADMFTDLLGSALSDVDYYEIAEHWINDRLSEQEKEEE